MEPGYVIIVIVLFLTAIMNCSIEYNRQQYDKVLGRFWIVHPFISPVIFGLSMLLSLIIQYDIVAYGWLLAMLQEFVFWIIKSVKKKNSVKIVKK